MLLCQSSLPSQSFQDKHSRTCDVVQYLDKLNNVNKLDVAVIMMFCLMQPDNATKVWLTDYFRYAGLHPYISKIMISDPRGQHPALFKLSKP